MNNVEPSARVDRRTFALLAFVVLSELDAATTYLGLAAGIPEGNALPAYLIARHGFAALLISKALVVLVCCGTPLLLPRLRRLWWPVYAGAALYALAVASNLTLIL